MLKFHCASADPNITSKDGRHNWTTITLQCRCARDTPTIGRFKYAVVRNGHPLKHIAGVLSVPKNGRRCRRCCKARDAQRSHKRSSRRDELSNVFFNYLPCCRHIVIIDSADHYFYALSLKEPYFCTFLGTKKAIFS